MKEFMFFYELRQISDSLNTISDSFWGDLLSGVLGAVVSGVIILMFSTYISKKVSKEEADKALKEMRERIFAESEANLSMQRMFYLKQILKKMTKKSTSCYNEGEKFLNFVDS